MTDASDETLKKTFAELGIVQELCKAISRLGWKEPTPIQVKAIPFALQGRDVVGLAKTGSGKTAAYAIPMIQRLLSKPQRMYGLVLTPTRELAFQVKDDIQSLGTKFGVMVTVLTGGMDVKAEKQKLNSKPHIIVATPGRLLDHLKKTKDFSLARIKYLVFDEADRMMAVDLEKHMNDIVRVLPRDRRTMLFSATMNKSAKKLKMQLLVDPVMVQVNEVIETVDTLRQHMKLVPYVDKMASLVWFLNELKANDDACQEKYILFCMTTDRVLQVHIALSQLTFRSVPFYGKMPQDKRMAALHKFKRKERNILVATDLASRGLDINDVDWVVNVDMPLTTKDYIHRVGRTARAGKQGQSITFICQYDYKEFITLESTLKVKMEEYPLPLDEVEILAPSVQLAEKYAQKEISRMRDDGSFFSKQHGKKRGPSEGRQSSNKKSKRSRD